MIHDHSKAEVLRSVTIPILKDDKKHGITFQVVLFEASTLLSCEEVIEHGLVIIPEQKQTSKNAIVYGSSVDIKYINFLQRNNSQTATWNTALKQPLTSLDEIKVQCKENFEEIGTFPGKIYHINTDPSIQPKWLLCQPVPVHQQDEFKKQLNEMLDAGVIMEVHEATPWINSFVIVGTVKDGKKKLRICLHPMPLSKAIRHESYITCTPDDVYHRLANAKYISVIDFKKSFWQFVLDEESSYLTTFNTPFGCYHYLRMPLVRKLPSSRH